jgi:hypothetical protein
VVGIVWELDLQLSLQSMHITSCEFFRRGDNYLANIPVFQSLDIIVLQVGVSLSEVTHISSSYKSDCILVNRIS